MKITISENEIELVSVVIEPHEKKVLDWDCLDFNEWVVNAISEKIRRTMDAAVSVSLQEMTDQKKGAVLTGVNAIDVLKSPKHWPKALKKKILDEAVLETAKDKNERLQNEFNNKSLPSKAEKKTEGG